ncbi:MAG: hypothetical protein LBT06_10720 [Hungatella sp.]|jgi:hypothetical protein|nr:hypothetical protein [Hungatella sp.]
MKIFVIGSPTNVHLIKRIAEKYGVAGSDVDYVKPESSYTFTQCVQQAFDKIMKSDIVVVIPKHDGSLKRGTIYEMIFAEEMGKQLDLFIEDVEE